MRSRSLSLIAVIAGTLMVVACAIPAWVNTVESDAEVAVPIAASLIAVIDPALAPLVTGIESGFTALTRTLDTYKASPTATNLQAVQSAFAAVDSNVAQLESAAQIKNTATQATVTAVVQLLAQAVSEIAARVPASAGPGVRSSVPGAPAAKGWTAHDFKREFNKIVKGDPRFRPLQ
jgi:hypothetical protein